MPGLRALLALKQAAESRAGRKRDAHLAQLQGTVRLLQYRKHPELVQQLQARAMALQGRGGDTEVAHVTVGEIVLPRALQTRAVLEALGQAAGHAGIPLNRLRVGSGRNAINPHTGSPEFFNPQDEEQMDEIVVTAPRDNGINNSALAVDEYGRSPEDMSNPDFQRGQGEALINALPGMGIARAMGYAPRWQEGDGFIPAGGVEMVPSVIDKVRDGSYGDGALTALGAVGDLGYAGIGGAAAKSFGQMRNYNRGMRAAEEVLANRADVMGAMKAPGSGPVDFRWNEGQSGGLEKVQRRHGEQSIRDVPEVLVYGQREEGVTDRGRPRIEYKLGDKEVALAPHYFGEPGHWVVTSFDRSKGRVPR